MKKSIKDINANVPSESFSIRKNARVTRCTLNKALGLDTLLKQFEHHYVFVCGHQEPPVSRELQKMVEHGTRNEFNSIACLVSTIRHWLP